MLCITILICVYTYKIIKSSFLKVNFMNINGYAAVDNNSDSLKI